mmetsp:Transcript_13019/g.19208  ORF Transcript_13019/g.19208 Transcript_13019/m.19208 type:complete len:237 (-) Transcript_13019:56-766(-)|eukprot:CAMPEP_0194046702 /NCGR_PEP_ID=MMETSP0009_2-20130614/22254_1 /TAXON_ID=210454 /ORGANISM="Grammatophora oceanica, Strain CCMP 410" /LENGTH=236 /DNA_ID=CAMNT_0038692101 /DNA_START=35 /DNA_END=745 /DNA_ORIENTATION=-
MWGWHQQRWAFIVLFALLAKVSNELLLVDSFQLDRATTFTRCVAREARPTQDVKGYDGATTGRRGFLRELSLSTAAALVSGVVLGTVPQVARAKYGDSSTIVLPNYIEFLEERARVDDPSTFLYQGADPVVLLKRLVEAATKLEEIPDLVENKKWSAINGVLTGPLGTLGQTLSQIQTAAPGGKSLASSVKQIKADLLDIGVAASRKSQDGCNSATDRARTDLASFAQAAFPKPSS